MPIHPRTLFMSVPYGFTEIRHCKPVLFVCEHIHLRNKNILPQ